MNIAGHKDLISQLAECLNSNVSRSPNKPKLDGSESVSFRIMASFNNKLNLSPLFYKLYNVINYTNLNFLPPTIKQIRLSMIERFEAIPRPFFLY